MHKPLFYVTQNLIAMDQMEEFEFNIGKARQTIALFISSSALLITLIVFTNERLFETIISYKLWFVVIGVVYLLFVSLLVFRFINSFYKPLMIRILKDSVSIPTYYLGIKKINIKEIYSVEEICLNNKIYAVGLGIFKRAVMQLMLINLPGVEISAVFIIL